MKMKFTIQIILVLILSVFPSLSVFLFAEAKDTVKNSEITQKNAAFLEERTIYLINQCNLFLKKAGWITSVNNGQIGAFRLAGGYDELSLKIDAVYDSGLYAFTIAINKNEKKIVKAIRLPGNVVSDDVRLRDISLSVLAPLALTKEGIGDFRKAFSSVFSFGYARTSDDNEFYPAYAKGKLHLSWELEYDPAARILSQETPLTFGDYMAFNVFMDWANVIRENFFNIDLLIYGKNKYSGSADHGTRFMYGFFNGIEYFRPGFSDSTMKWDQPIYNDKPFIQYTIWRVLQWNMLIARRNGSSLYSAELMLGAGMGVGPSSLFYSSLSEEEEQNMSRSFRSIKYRKQNYYFSYSLPARLLLCADNIAGFRFELGYNYYFFFPVISDNLYDMLHVFKGSIGYYLTSDVILSAQYERWRIESMLHDKTRTHDWNRLIIVFKNYF